MEQLKPQQVYSLQEAEALLSKLAGMLNRGELKVLKGSLNASPRVDFEFKGAAARWSLRGVLDVHGGIILTCIA